MKNKKNKKKWILIGSSIVALAVISSITIPITLNIVNSKKTNQDLVQLNITTTEMIFTSKSNNFNFEIIKPTFNLEINKQYINNNKYKLSLTIDELIISIDNEFNQISINPCDINLSLILNYQINNEPINMLNIIFNLNNEQINIQDKSELKFVDFNLFFDVEIIEDNINKINNQNVNFKLV